MNTHCRPLRGRGLRSLLLLAFALAPAIADAAAGQVLFALGRVEIQRGGQTFAAPRGAPVEVGDTISTGPTGLAQVRMRDGALLSLRHGSTLKVEDFDLPQAAPAAVAPATPSAAPAAAAPGRSVLRLLRGAFRTVTGLIGKSAGDSYSVITPVATIGIRGTDYSAAYCSGDCGTTPDGLYVGVSNGEIALNNAAGELVLTNDQYGYVKDNSTPPDQELAPPDVLETPIAPEEEGEEDEERTDTAETVAEADAVPEDSSFREEGSMEGSIEAGSDQPEGDYELRPGEGGSYAYSAPGHKGSSDNGLFLDERGDLIGFLDGEFTNIGTAQNVNTGFDPDTGLRWGRWSNGVASVGDASLDLSNQSLHWVYGAAADRAALPITGTRSYSLVGNTDPTDNAGAVGFLGDAQLSADFTNQTVTSSVSVGFGDVASGGTLWQASGNGSILSGTVEFQGNYASVTVNGSAAGTSGGFAGFFTPGADAAGLIFSLTDGSTIVNGAAAFAGATAAAPAALGAP